MPADFLDTSALAKHYHAEVGSAEIDRLWNDPAHGLFVSRLSVLEIVSVFTGKVRAGAISAVDFEALRRRFSADLAKTKRLVGTRLLVAHFQEAERLLRQHGTARRLRTLDALQLAVAIDLHRRRRSTALFRRTEICLRRLPLKGWPSLIRKTRDRIARRHCADEQTRSIWQDEPRVVRLSSFG